MKVKRTERGWAGHFICSDRCKFRRNTLLEYEGKYIIVSTIGAMIDPITLEFSTVGGIGRYYETMVFYGENQDGYIDADVSRSLDLDGIYADKFESLPYTIDNDANNMHESMVEKYIEKLERGEV